MKFVQFVIVVLLQGFHGIMSDVDFVQAPNVVEEMLKKEYGTLCSARFQTNYYYKSMLSTMSAFCLEAKYDDSCDRDAAKADIDLNLIPPRQFCTMDPTDITGVNFDGDSDDEDMKYKDIARKYIDFLTYTTQSSYSAYAFAKYRRDDFRKDIDKIHFEIRRQLIIFHNKFLATYLVDSITMSELTRILKPIVEELAKARDINLELQRRLEYVNDEILLEYRLNIRDIKLWQIRIGEVCSIMWHNFRVMLTHSYYKKKCSQVKYTKRNFQKYGQDDKVYLLDSQKVDQEDNAAAEYNEAVATEKYKTNHKETIVQRVAIFFKTFFKNRDIPIALKAEQFSIDSSEDQYYLNDSAN